MLLKMENVTMAFGGLKAVDGFSLQLNEGELVGLIGPNGAGKTTVFNVITGVYTPERGDILFNPGNGLHSDPLGGHASHRDISGRGLIPKGSSKGITAQKGSPYRINGLRPDLITRLGVARTFQNIRLFPEMSVLENILVSLHWSHEASVFQVLLRTKKYRQEEQEMIQEAMGFLRQVNLDHLSHVPGASLPYGSQRRLEIARALAAKPRLLLLDEPAAGMNPKESIDLMAFIEKIRRDFGITILLIEHQMRVVMGVSDRIVVMDHGVVISEGTPLEVARDPKVIEAYLGVEEEKERSGSNA